MTATRRESFTVAAGDEGSVTLEVRLPAGDVRVQLGDPGRLDIEIVGTDPDELQVEQAGSRVVVEHEWAAAVRWERYRVTARVPPEPRLVLRLASADVTVETPLSALEADTASGELRAGDVAGATTVRSASGAVSLRTVGGRLKVTTASGAATVACSVDEASLRTAAGDVRVGRAQAQLRARTASGDVEVGVFEGEDLDCATVSGHVAVGLPAGRTLDVDLQTLSGRIHNDFGVDAPAGDGHGRVRLRTVSGDIRLQRTGPT